MSGRRGARIVPVAMAIAIVAQLLPVVTLAGEGPAKSTAYSGQLQGVGFDIPMPKAGKTAAKSDDDKSGYAFQQLDEEGDASLSSGKTLQGTVTSINVTRGRSQIVKFAQPIMRMSIAQPDVADVIPLAPDQIMINGKLRGVTSLIVWDENGQEGIFDLYVQNDTSELLEAVKAVAPREKIQARVTDDSFILTGQVSSSVTLDEIRKTAAAYGYREDKFIDLTDTPVPQVMLEVKMVEANRSVGRQLKTSFNLENSNQAFNAVRLANPIDGKVLEGAARQTSGLRADRLFRTGSSPLNNIALSQAGGNVGGLTGSMYWGKHFQSVWDLLETKGKINTLANPTLVCTHGRSASFLAGGEFPFVGSVDANGSPIVSYKEFGVKLNFTPWIAIKSGRIELTVQPEVSSVDSSHCVTSTSGNQVCGILKRTTNTTVELMDGESLMISGILSREEQNTFANVPFIASVPILGNMFRNANMSKNDSELIVIVTPHIIKSSDYGRILGAAQ
ncbi:MAG TPA: pilus assembly protein N-terminal domain-containing protein [Coleofasciculaceae cyanobacterium]